MQIDAIITRNINYNYFFDYFICTSNSNSAPCTQLKPLIRFIQISKIYISESKRRLRASQHTQLIQRQLNINWKIACGIIIVSSLIDIGPLCIHCVYGVWIGYMLCVFGICRDMDISYFVPIFQSFYEPNISQLTFLNAYFAIHKSARSFIPRLMLSLSCICFYFQTTEFSKTECFSECRCKGNDNDNGKVKIFFDSFPSFVSPLIFSSFISFLHSIRVWVYVCGILCDNHQPDHRRWWHNTADGVYTIRFDRFTCNVVFVANVM